MHDMGNSHFIYRVVGVLFIYSWTRHFISNCHSGPAVLLMGTRQEFIPIHAQVLQ